MIDPDGFATINCPVLTWLLHADALSLPASYWLCPGKSWLPSVVARTFLAGERRRAETKADGGPADENVISTPFT
jgi:hypothetical protein